MDADAPKYNQPTGEEPQNNSLCGTTPNTRHDKDIAEDDTLTFVTAYRERKGGQVYCNRHMEEVVQY